MNKARLAAFTDGVIAVIITIMVLEMKVPHGSCRIRGSRGPWRSRRLLIDCCCAIPRALG